MTSVSRVPSLVFTQHAWRKLQYFLQLSTHEISGFGRVTDYDSNFLVDEIYLINQTVSSVHTQMSAIEIGKFVSQLAAYGGDISNLKLWWHSHVNMGLFWSPDDEKTMADLTRQYYFGLVGLKNGKVLARLDIARPRTSIDNIPVSVIEEVDESLQEKCRQEIKEKVTLVAPPKITKPKRFEKDNPPEESCWLEYDWR